MCACIYIYIYIDFPKHLMGQRLIVLATFSCFFFVLLICVCLYKIEERYEDNQYSCVIVKLNIRKDSVIWVKSSYLLNNMLGFKWQSSDHIEKGNIYFIKITFEWNKKARLETCKTSLDWLLTIP